MPLLPDRHYLRFGQYRTPRFRVGQVITCDIQGECEIVGVSDARIPWPIGKRGRKRFLILFGALARAVRKESSVAVCHHWGVTTQTVTKWRKALGVGRMNAVSTKLASAYGKTPARVRGLQKAQSKAGDELRPAKIAASRRGKPMPAAVKAKLLAANRGRKLSDETRRKMSEAHKRPSAASETTTAIGSPGCPMPRRECSGLPQRSRRWFAFSSR